MDEEAALRLKKLERTLRREIALNRRQGEHIKRLALLIVASLLFKFNESQLEGIIENYKLYEPYADIAVSIIIGGGGLVAAKKDESDEDGED